MENVNYSAALAPPIARAFIKMPRINVSALRIVHLFAMRNRIVAKRVIALRLLAARMASEQNRC